MKHEHVLMKPARPRQAMCAVLLVTVMSTLSGCKSKAASSGSPGKVDLPTLGLTIDLLSTKATVAQSAIYRDKGVTISSKSYQDDIHVAVHDSMPTPEEETKPSDPTKERDFKIEKLTDGFVVTFVKSYGTAADRFMVRAYRAIAGKNVSCSGNGTTPERQQAVIDACKSLATK